MSIVYRKGNVIEALKEGHIQVLAHGVNCSGGFGSGVAGQIAQEFPEVKLAYMQDYSNGLWQLGRVSFVSTTHSVKRGEMWVANCATQFKYGRNPEQEPNGRYCNYAAIAKCMAELQNKTTRLNTIGMPMIGAGLAAGDWKIIEAIINDEFVNRDVFVYKWSPKT